MALVQMGTVEEAIEALIVSVRGRTWLHTPPCTHLDTVSSVATATRPQRQFSFLLLSLYFTFSRALIF